MAGRPLSPAIRLRLGGPLPRLLADRTRVPLLPDCSFHLSAYAVLASVSKCCPPAGDRSSRVTHPSATWLYSKQASYITPFDLHVLGTPPAFVLSQDQTLRLIPVSLQLIHSFRMNQSPAQVARLFFYLLDFRFALALRASLRFRLCSSVFPCHGASPLSFRPAPKFPSRPPSRGATRESILRLKRFVNYFFQLFSSNAGERVRVNLSFFAVHNEGGARQNFLKLHASGTAFHDLRRAPRVAERLARSWRAGRRYGAFADFTAAALRLGDGAGARLFPMNCGGFAGFR